MQFSTLFYAIVAFATVAAASPTAITNIESTNFISEAEFAHWLANTDAELTFVGPRPDFSPLGKRSAQSTALTYCNKRIGSVCGGSCTVYSGGATCINAPGTACIASTRDIGYCDTAGCAGDCSLYSACGTMLPGGFCAAEGTESILVSPL
ncbi:hypothetical protein C8Q78DRAFT_1082741 [Trametes maxima]|nr:hypothetical protein C8Q78DRAFT_1082741 [Trametes maxima]